jgi:hypothetical protein
METRDWIAIGGLIAASAAFVSGLWQYRRAQQWKRAEFVASEMKAFEQDPLVAKALVMLDHNGRPVQLFTESEEKDPQQRSPYVDDTDLTKALMHHRHRRHGFSAKELAIRDCFDRLLDRLSTFESYIQAGLISHKELECYLLYWIDIMARSDSQRKPKPFYNSFWDYIDGYHYDSVQRLFMRYGFNIWTPDKEMPTKPGRWFSLFRFRRR